MGVPAAGLADGADETDAAEVTEIVGVRVGVTAGVIEMDLLADAGGLDALADLEGCDALGVFDAAAGLDALGVTDAATSLDAEADIDAGMVEDDTDACDFDGVTLAAALLVDADGAGGDTDGVAEAAALLDEADGAGGETDGVAEAAALLVDADGAGGDSVGDTEAATTTTDLLGVADAAAALLGDALALADVPHTFSVCAYAKPAENVMQLYDTSVVVVSGGVKRVCTHDGTVPEKRLWSSSNVLSDAVLSVLGMVPAIWL